MRGFGFAKFDFCHTNHPNIREISFSTSNSIKHIPDYPGLRSGRTPNPGSGVLRHGPTASSTRLSRRPWHLRRCAAIFKLIFKWHFQEMLPIYFPFQSFSKDSFDCIIFAFKNFHFIPGISSLLLEHIHSCGAQQFSLKPKPPPRVGNITPAAGGKLLQHLIRSP